MLSLGWCKFAAFLLTGTSHLSHKETSLRSELLEVFCQRPVWPGLCREQSRSSSSVTTLSRAVDRLSSSAVGSTIRMELQQEHTRFVHVFNKLNFHKKSQTYFSMIEKEVLTGCLWTGSLCRSFESTSGLHVTLLMVTFGRWAGGIKKCNPVYRLILWQLTRWSKCKLFLLNMIST